jgi:hypothetical protein
MTAKRTTHIAPGPIVIVLAVVVITDLLFHLHSRQTNAVQTLIDAVKRHDPAAVHAALTEGADPNRRDDPVQHLDLERRAKIAVQQHLVADADIQPGDPALALAFEEADQRSGAVFFRIREDDVTRSRIREIARELIESGANVNTPGVLGLAPIDLARAAGLDDVVALLTAKGGRSSLCGSPACTAVRPDLISESGVVYASGPARAVRQTYVATLLRWRSLWARWANAHRPLLSRLQAPAYDENALWAVWSALPARTTTASTGLDPKEFRSKGPWFQWEPGSKSLPLSSREKALEAEWLRSDYRRLRDIAVIHEFPEGPVRYTLWASGRITEDTHRRLYPWNAEERELAPPLP